jgi:hypothetical protein
MNTFGSLKKLSLRDIWQNESTDFTPWLQENISALSEALGMELEVKQREADVGDFSLDLLAHDVGSNRVVIIENQLKETDHDHLGKILTYASGYNASVIIWIAESIRDEHRQALEWLNQRTDDDTEFFGVVIEILQIDNSKPAFNFKPVIFPNEWQKTTSRSSSGQTSPKMESYRKYFQSLIDTLRTKHHFTNAKVGQPQSWYAFSTGFSKIVYGMSFALGNRIRTDLYIDLGDSIKNKLLFDIISRDKELIEKEYGNKLEWERLDDKRSCRIAIYRDGSIESDEVKLKEIEKWSADNLLKMKKVFGNSLNGYLKQLEDELLVNRPG